MKNKKISQKCAKNIFLYNLIIIILKMPTCIQNIIQPKFWSALATAPAEASAVAKVAIIINKILIFTTSTF